MKDNTLIKKKSARPPEPNAPVIINTDAKAAAPTGEAAQETAQLKLSAFPDGYVFHFAQHPTAVGQFVLFSPDNIIHAVCQNAAIADLLCNATRMLFAAVAQQHAESLTPEQLAANNAAHKEQGKRHAVEVETGGATGTTCSEVEGR